MKPDPGRCSNCSSVTEPPTPSPNDEVREMMSVSKGLIKLEADESWVFALILICCLAALVACLFKLL